MVFSLGKALVMGSTYLFFAECRKAIYNPTLCAKKHNILTILPSLALTILLQVLIFLATEICKQIMKMQCHMYFNGLQ
jgi:hypothetical protein